MTTFWKSNFNLSGMFAKLLDWRLLLQRSYLMKTLPYYMDALQKNCFLSPQSLLQGVPVLTECCWSQGAQTQSPVHNVQFVKYDVTVSFMAQVLNTVAYFVSHVLVVDKVTYFDIFR